MDSLKSQYRPTNPAFYPADTFVGMPVVGRQTAFQIITTGAHSDFTSIRHERSDSTNRIIEWVLAGMGAILCVGGAAFTWLSQASSNSSNASLWPLPALVLIEVAILGLAAFSGVVMNNQQDSSRWGRVMWVACGGLTALAIIGAFSVSVLVLLAVPALLFGGAAILADIRQHRNLLTNIGVFTVSTVTNLVLIFVLISVART